MSRHDARPVERERHLELEASFNFRDLGGLETSDGRRVRWGTVYRSDSLRWLTAADAATLRRIGLRTVIDLRTTNEVTGGRLSPHVVDVALHHTPVFEDDDLPYTPFVVGEPDPPPGVTYITVASKRAEAIATAIRAIAGAEPAVVFHCAAGKDRTGVLAALLLAALGVDDEVIVEDYVRSERALEPTLAWAKIHAPELAAGILGMPGWLVHATPDHMWAFLDHLNVRYGSARAFLTAIGIDEAEIEGLRDRFLE